MVDVRRGDHNYGIGVVEDHAVANAGLRQILSVDPSLVIVAAAPTVADLLSETTDLDLAILDLRLPDGSSPVTNVEQLRKAGIKPWCSPPPTNASWSARTGGQAYLVSSESPSVKRLWRRRFETWRKAG
jgi:CheY-like chemotaxis protein